MPKDKEKKPKEHDTQDKPTNPAPNEKKSGNAGQRTESEMATTHIVMDDQTDLGRQLSRSMQLLREGRESLTHALAHFTHMVDGNGSDAAQFTLAVTQGVYTTTAHAKSSWDEIQSLNAVVEAAEAAILQACAKHGI